MSRSNFRITSKMGVIDSQICSLATRPKLRDAFSKSELRTLLRRQTLEKMLVLSSIVLSIAAIAIAFIVAKEFPKLSFKLGLSLLALLGAGCTILAFHLSGGMMSISNKWDQEMGEIPTEMLENIRQHYFTHAADEYTRYRNQVVEMGRTLDLADIRAFESHEHMLKAWESNREEAIRREALHQPT